MATIRRANVILDIKDDQIDYYVNQGFDVIDANGGVITKSTPRDVNALTDAYHKHTAEIEALQEENKQLKAEIAKLKKAKKPAQSKSTSKAPAKKKG